MVRKTILCPVCGGHVNAQSIDSINRCSYCGSPVLGPSQSRDCVNHSGTLAKGVCNVCGDLVCENCMEQRTGNYGGKLFTIVNCRKSACVSKSEWALLLNDEYKQLTNMDWADSIDNSILRVSGLGSILMIVFELFFIFSMLVVTYFTTWGFENLPYFIFRGDIVVVLSLLGNLLSALILQSSLQVYIHNRQLGSGVMMLLFLIFEVALLIYRGLVFNILSFPNPYYTPFLLGAFLFATLLIFVGSVLAIRTGNRKSQQLKHARDTLGLTADRGIW
ncbi:MAG: B-box zinc finger protein [Candidatus Thorarchaeota archaeon]